jgi:hypothetical protein
MDSASAGLLERSNSTATPTAADRLAATIASSWPRPAVAAARLEWMLDSQTAPEGAPAIASCTASAAWLACSTQSAADPSHSVAGARVRVRR